MLIPPNKLPFEPIATGYMELHLAGQAPTRVQVSVICSDTFHPTKGPTQQPTQQTPRPTPKPTTKSPSKSPTRKPTESMFQVLINVIRMF